MFGEHASYVMGLGVVRVSVADGGVSAVDEGRNGEAGLLVLVVVTMVVVVVPVETVVLVKAVAVDITPGGLSVVVVVIVAVDVAVFVTAGMVVVLVMEAVLMMVFVVTCSTTSPQNTAFGYSCGLKIGFAACLDRLIDIFSPGCALATSPEAERPLTLGE